MYNLLVADFHRWQKFNRTEFLFDFKMLSHVIRVLQTNNYQNITEKHSVYLNEFGRFRHGDFNVNDRPRFGRSSNIDNGIVSECLGLKIFNTYQLKRLLIAFKHW